MLSSSLTPRQSVIGSFVLQNLQHFTCQSEAEMWGNRETPDHESVMVSSRTGQSQDEMLGKVCRIHMQKLGLLLEQKQDQIK